MWYIKADKSLTTTSFSNEVKIENFKKATSVGKNSLKHEHLCYQKNFDFGAASDHNALRQLRRNYRN